MPCDCPGVESGAVCAWLSAGKTLSSRKLAVIASCFGMRFMERPFLELGFSCSYIQPCTRENVALPATAPYNGFRLAFCNREVTRALSCCQKASQRLRTFFVGLSHFSIAAAESAVGAESDS